MSEAKLEVYNVAQKSQKRQHEGQLLDLADLPPLAGPTAQVQW